MAKTIKTLKFAQKVNKVFIIPNNLGMYFIGVWATCFLLSVGYASNLLLFMAILQFALFFWWMITAHADTSQFKIQSITCESFHAKSQADLRVHWSNPDLSKELRVLNLMNDKNEKFTVSLANPPKLQMQQRGIYHFKKIEIGLTTGFWLFKTWKYVPINMAVTIYPEAIKSPYDLKQNVTLVQDSSEIKQLHTQAVELDLQRDADEKTRANRINWKRFAQSGKLVERFGESGQQIQQTFDLDAVQSEDQLSFITYEINAHFKQQQSWYLKHKNQVLGPFNILGNNKDELHQCLSLLAIHSW
jgi:uncharacterized protein (DUF58 family)